MAEPVREQALAKVAEKLASMTGIRGWGGEYPNAPIVERVFKTPAQAQEMPWLCVIEAPGSQFEIDRTATADHATYLHTFRVLIYGYVRGDSSGGVARATWLQRLWDDVVTTLLKNATLDGVVRDLEIENNGPETDEGDLEPIGAFEQAITITMDELKEIG